MSILHRTPRTVLLAAVLAAAIPGAASAATRYVSPNSSAKSPCDAATPCNFKYVVEGPGSQVGDTVVLTAGTYDVGGGLSPARRLELVADPNAASRPLIESTLPKGVAVDVGVLAWGSSFKGIDIEASSDTASIALVVRGSITASDVHLSCHYRCLFAGYNNATATLEDSEVHMNSGSVAVQMDNGGTVRRSGIFVDGGGSALWLGNGSHFEDSTIESDGYGADLRDSTVERVAIRADRPLAVTGTSLVRDSLLLSNADHEVALRAFGTATVRNVTAIATGAGSTGVLAGGDVIDKAKGANVRNTIARGTDRDVAGTAASDQGFYCPCPAVPLDIAYSNFRTWGPETYDLGHNQSADPKFVDGAKGDFRLAPGSPAIDAGSVDPFVGTTALFGAARKQGAAPDLGAFETTPPPKPADKTAPAVTKLKVLRKKPARVRFRLSEAASVKVAIFRKPNGKKTATARTVKFAAKAGLNTRQIAKKALRPGSYVFVAVATDAAKNNSAPVTRKLIVKAP